MILCVCARLRLWRYCGVKTNKELRLPSDVERRSKKQWEEKNPNATNGNIFEGFPFHSELNWDVWGDREIAAKRSHAYFQRRVCNWTIMHALMHKLNQRYLRRMGIQVAWRFKFINPFTCQLVMMWVRTVWTVWSSGAISNKFVSMALLWDALLHITREQFLYFLLQARRCLH